MKPPRHIVWSTNKLDLSNPFIKKWYLEKVLENGRAEDIASLNWKEIKKLLPEMNLPENIKRLWLKYFNMYPLDK
jgi:hypothetical protein